MYWQRFSVLNYQPNRTIYPLAVRSVIPPSIDCGMDVARKKCLASGPIRSGRSRIEDVQEIYFPVPPLSLPSLNPCSISSFPFLLPSLPLLTPPFRSFKLAPSETSRGSKGAL